jgi:hypothetical protein
MFIRFVVPVRHRHSHCLTGVFHAAFDLRDRGLLTGVEGARFERLRQWFNRHLPIPDRFARSRQPHAHASAICWFKDDAAEHLEWARELAALLARHGVATQVLRTDKPGYVVYEDDYQVAAVPFRDTIS